MMRCLTEREQERVWELRAEGLSSRAIGRELGSGRNTFLSVWH
jgi:IS30 family transposase